MRIWILATALLAALCTQPSMATDIPEYRVIQRIDKRIEIRQYEALIVAETLVSADAYKAAGNAGFRVLADYIFGNNQGKREIAMTAPVEQRRGGSKIAMTAPVEQSAAANGSWIIAFTMPKEWSMASLPVPNNPNVKLREVPSRTIAAIRFSGLWSDKQFAKQQAMLITALANANLSTAGQPWTARYDPPWIPWFARRNEVLVEVVQAK